MRSEPSVTSIPVCNEYVALDVLIIVLPPNAAIATPFIVADTCTPKVSSRSSSVRPSAVVDITNVPTPPSTANNFLPLELA